MASAALTALVEANAPRRPYRGPEKNFARIRAQSDALRLPYVQLNPPAHCAWLLIDIDRPDAGSAWLDGGLPAPTYVATNRENGHAYIGYALAAPVCTTDAARLLPMHYRAAIEQAYLSGARADFSFAGPLAKNPLHPRWKVWESANAPAYELGHLAEYVDLSNRIAPPAPEGFGRNCSLFDNLREWAYSSIRSYWQPGGAVRWYEAVRRQAEAWNA
jgi:hypothetical protein